MLLGHKEMKRTEHYAKIIDRLARTGIQTYQDSFAIYPIEAIEDLKVLPIGNLGHNNKIP